MWVDRCYCSDIPDEVPAKLMAQNRAPSYKAVAMAILKNDHKLRSLGFGEQEPEWIMQMVRNQQRAQCGQLELFEKAASGFSYAAGPS